MLKISDENLVTAAVNADIEALEMLEDRIRSGIHVSLERFAQQYGLDIEVMAPQILIEVQQQVLTGLHKYRFVCPFQEWVRRLTYRAVIRYNNRQFRRARKSKGGNVVLN